MVWPGEGKIGSRKFGKKWYNKKNPRYWEAQEKVTVHQNMSKNLEHFKKKWQKQLDHGIFRWTCISLHFGSWVHLLTIANIYPGRPGSRIGLRQARASCNPIVSHHLPHSLSLSRVRNEFELKSWLNNLLVMFHEELWIKYFGPVAILLCWIWISWMPSTLQHHKIPGKIKTWKNNNKHDTINTHTFGD